MVEGAGAGSGGSATYAWSGSSRGGGVRGFGRPNGLGGGGPDLLFCLAKGGLWRIVGDSVRIAEWSGVFKEVVEAFRTPSGSLNGLFIVAELECEEWVSNFRSIVGVLAPEGGGVRSRSSRGTPSSFSLPGSTWCPTPTDRGR